MSILKMILGDPNKKLIDKADVIVKQINDLESKVSILSDDELKNQTNIFKEKLSNSTDVEKTLNEILPEVFATCREASKRVLGMRHFDVQLIAGYFLHKGFISEMKTGEGKTLVATLPAYLNSLTDKGVHVVTVNDYLAKRDSEWMGKLYTFLGVSTAFVGHITSLRLDYVDQEDGSNVLEFVPVSRRDAYACGITYGTNNEFGFDYLRDNMVFSSEEKVQRKLNYTIVDEVDSILIDEARTPLIISSTADESTEKYYIFSQIVKKLNKETDYNIDEKLKSVTLTDEGLKKVEEYLNIKNIYTSEGVALVHHLEEALKAEVLFTLDKDYVVKDGEVVIVDEFTGRMMPGRRYSEGLHQAIEAKEGIQIQNESLTLATITLQNYFRMYNKLSGMTGTAMTEAEEFSKIYKLETVVIPTNRINIRKDLNDRIYKNEDAKFNAVIEEVRERHTKGQPVLIGTISIEKNEKLHRLLEKAGIPHNILNAKNHEREAEIIAQAGKVGGVTIATNMAGRGVDIMLGGNPQEKEEFEKVKELGGLCVIGTERHESRRIDNQLRGRSARQGDPGSTLFFVSLEDDLMRIFGSDRIKSMMNNLGIPDDMPIENSIISKQLEGAQKRVEGHNFDIRKHLVEYDDVINQHRNIIYRKRDEILENSEKTKEIIYNFVSKDVERVIKIHTAIDDIKSWGVKEMFDSINSVINLTETDLVTVNDIVNNDSDFEKKRTDLLNLFNSLIEKSYKNLEEKIENNFLRQIEKSLLLKVIDTLWIDHLDNINNLRMSIGLRGYGQRDPLVEYKKEAFNLFEELMNSIRHDVASNIFKINISTEQISNIPKETQNFSNIEESGPKEIGQFNANVQDIFGKDSIREKMDQEIASNSSSVSSEYAGVGRNDVCPCGSGKKFKKCHGA